MMRRDNLSLFSRKRSFNPNFVFPIKPNQTIWETKEIYICVVCPTTTKNLAIRDSATVR